jgi:hypothetical protein
MSATKKLLTELNDKGMQGRMTLQSMMLLAHKLGVWDESFLFKTKLEAWNIIKSKFSNQQIEATLVQSVQTYKMDDLRRKLEIDDMAILAKLLEMQDSKGMHDKIRELVISKDVHHELARFLGISVQMLNMSLKASGVRAESHRRLWRILDFFGLKLKLSISKSQEGN